MSACVYCRRPLGEAAVEMARERYCRVECARSHCARSTDERHDGQAPGARCTRCGQTVPRPAPPPEVWAPLSEVINAECSAGAAVATLREQIRALPAQARHEPLRLRLRADLALAAAKWGMLRVRLGRAPIAS